MMWFVFLIYYSKQSYITPYGLDGLGALPSNIDVRVQLLLCKC